MWGRAKLVVLLSAEGFEVSESTVGRILQRLSLVACGSVPACAAAALCQGEVWASGRELAAAACPAPARGHLADRPGRPDPAGRPHHQHAPQAPRSCTHGLLPARPLDTSTEAAAFLDKVLADMPFLVAALQLDGAFEFMASSRPPGRIGSCRCSSCLPNRPSSMARSSTPTAARATRSTLSTTCPTPSPGSTHCSTAPLPRSPLEGLPPRILPPTTLWSPRRLRSPDPGQPLATSPEL